MDNVIYSLDEYFCAHYSNYVQLSAIEGYKMPDMVYIGPDGNIVRRDNALMRLCHQKNCGELLKKLKEGRVDTDFMFSFSFPTLRERRALQRGKYAFRTLFPVILHHCSETVESVGEKLDIEPRFWEKIALGKLRPTKNTLLAIALVCRMGTQDASNLLTICGETLSEDSVRDVVVRYLLEQKIFSQELRDRCLAEYKITNLPIKREKAI